MVGVAHDQSLYGREVTSPSGPTPLVDHHQHLFSPAIAALISTASDKIPEISGADLVGHLDAAGVGHAVVHSVAYIFSQPHRKIEDDHERVRAENDWTSEQVGASGGRLIGSGSVNPLRPYALEEIARSAGDPNLRAGLKLHLANAALDYHDPAHIALVRRVFSEANDRGLAITIHMRPSIELGRTYGADEARIFLDEILPAAPDVVVQIAHLCGTGSFVLDPPVDPALSVFIEAIGRGDPRTTRLWFDVTTVATDDMTAEQSELLATRIRQVGVERVVYGSDAALPTREPKAGWARFRKLPLTEGELATIASNVAPHVRRALEPAPLRSSS